MFHILSGIICQKPFPDHILLYLFPDLHQSSKELQNDYYTSIYKYSLTVKSRLSERRSSETTGLFEDDGQSRLFSLLSIAIKLPIIQISIIRKIQFFEVIRRSRLKKLLLNYPSKFEVQKSRMVIMISLFGRVRFTHLSDLANKVTPDKFTLLRDEPLSE